MLGVAKSFKEGKMKKTFWYKNRKGGFVKIHKECASEHQFDSDTDPIPMLSSSDMAYLFPGRNTYLVYPGNPEMCFWHRDKLRMFDVLKLPCAVCEKL